MRLKKPKIESWEKLNIYPIDAKDFSESIVRYRIKPSGKIKSVTKTTLNLTRGEIAMLFTILNKEPVSKIKDLKSTKEKNLSNLNKKLRNYFGLSDNPIGRNAKTVKFSCDPVANVMINDETSDISDENENENSLIDKRAFNIHSANRNDPEYDPQKMLSSSNFDD